MVDVPSGLVLPGPAVNGYMGTYLDHCSCAEGVVAQLCGCGYQACTWCWHHIANKLGGACPGCGGDMGNPNSAQHMPGGAGAGAVAASFPTHTGSANSIMGYLSSSCSSSANNSFDARRMRRGSDDFDQHADFARSFGSEAGGSGYLASPQFGGRRGGPSGGGGGHSGPARSLSASNVLAGPGSRGPNRRALQHLRVIQRNLVYVIGLGPGITAGEAASPPYFGQYGRIAKIVVNHHHGVNADDPRHGSASAYVTFAHKEDAWSAIKAVDGFWLEGRHVRASFGTTKYCNSFLRGLACNNGDCLYLHELGDERDRFTKEEIQAGLARHGSSFAFRDEFRGSGGAFDRPSGSGVRTACPILPPPAQHWSPPRAGARAPPLGPPLLSGGGGGGGALVRTASQGGALQHGGGGAGGGGDYGGCACCAPHVLLRRHPSAACIDWSPRPTLAGQPPDVYTVAGGGGGSGDGDAAAAAAAAEDAATAALLAEGLSRLQLEQQQQQCAAAAAAAVAGDKERQEAADSVATPPTRSVSDTSCSGSASNDSMASAADAAAAAAADGGGGGGVGARVPSLGDMAAVAFGTAASGASDPLSGLSAIWSTPTDWVSTSSNPCTPSLLPMAAPSSGGLMGTPTGGPLSTPAPPLSVSAPCFDPSPMMAPHPGLGAGWQQQQQQQHGLLRQSSWNGGMPLQQQQRFAHRTERSRSWCGDETLMLRGGGGGGGAGGGCGGLPPPHPNTASCRAMSFSHAPPPQYGAPSPLLQQQQQQMYGSPCGPPRQQQQQQQQQQGFAFDMSSGGGGSSGFESGDGGGGGGGYWAPPQQQQFDLNGGSGSGGGSYYPALSPLPEPHGLAHGAEHCDGGASPLGFAPYSTPEREAEAAAAASAAAGVGSIAGGAGSDDAAAAAAELLRA